MEPSTDAAITLRLLKSPALDQVLRAASPIALRAFAVACGRLALELTRDDQPPGVAARLSQSLDMASLLVQGVSTEDPDLVIAREEARELARTLDSAQLDLLAEVEEAAERAGLRTAEHPRYLAYGVAASCHRAAEIVAHALHDDAFAGAVECAYILATGMRIDIPTVLAIARANIPAAPP